MYVTIITNDYDNITEYNNITSSNYSNYNNMTLCNFTDNENDIDIIIPALIFITPWGISFVCLISLMVYTVIKPLMRKK